MNKRGVMERAIEANPEWLLYWCRQGSAALANAPDALWADLDLRERAAGVRDATPILLDPAARVDPRLARFLGRSRFALLALGTREAYVKDYRLFFTFLWRRGRYWDEASSDDIDDYEAWRRRAPENPQRIGGAKWARELAAFTLFYGWAVDKGHVVRNPVVFQTMRRRDGSTYDTAANHPKDVRYSNVKWVTPRTFRLWRDVGLRGYERSGMPQPGWRGRNDGRNTAFADLLFESGLRLREGGCLLTFEVPATTIGRTYVEGTVAAAVAKNRERMFYVPAKVVDQISAYVATTRRAVILRAQRGRRYEALKDKLVVSAPPASHPYRLEWTDERGGTGRAPAGALGPGERQRLFIEGPQGLEPLQLWLTEGGMPMDYRSWEAVFGAANDRCSTHGTPVRLTPHMCRHSFALKMLVTLQRAFDERFGLDAKERDHLRKVYGDVFSLVKDLLGHRSEETTRNIYLEPLNGVRLAMILDGSEDLGRILAGVAASSRLVVDIADAGQ
ncbi:site-specific integrase [Mycobacteroides salmoniphilum]|uniref:site-specific integrase n=1 Tax=Mycobacteroides salmoniphilum TaxID=404941 RepID=UPI0010646C75|nr:site-specific integrase [Mycobacteroides salmoniphilum]